MGTGMLLKERCDSPSSLADLLARERAWVLGWETRWDVREEALSVARFSEVSCKRWASRRASPEDNASQGRTAVGDGSSHPRADQVQLCLASILR